MTAAKAYEIVYPLRRKGELAQPFPTIYWLSDPKLDRDLADLERLGHVSEIEQQLAAAPDLLAGHHRDHAAYRDTRWQMLSEADRALVSASDSLTQAFNTGIAGIADFDRVKCLHAQYAYHLAQTKQGGTTVGSIIERLLDTAKQPEP